MIRTINLLFILEKLAGQNCFKDNVDAFEKATFQFYSRHWPVIFLLNIVLNVKDLWEQYCFCDKVGVPLCSVCQFWAVYLNDQYDIYENSFDLDFFVKISLARI